MAETELIGTVLDGRYKVIEPIAEGAMGGVYRGERIGLGRAVAIKVMHQELPDELASRQRFEREAKLMALLEHPNCVSVIDFGLHEDKPYLVMDLVRGTSLIQLLDKVGSLEPAKACDIIRQVLAGLAHAHELGIIHRDIKPANIMISEKAGFGQQVRILDFGLARLTESSTKLTTGIVVGTPNYMSPEQCKGGDIDARTDLYACGVMLFEMLTGRKPFVADDPIQVVRKHLLEKPPTLASVAPKVDFGELEAVVAKALAKAPKDRFESAVDMAKAVEAAANKAAQAAQTAQATQTAQAQAPQAQAPQAQAQAPQAQAQAKTSAAAVYARAVPEGAPVPSQQATVSGWNVPAEAQASIPLSDSAILSMSTELPVVQSGTPPPVPPAHAAPPPPVPPAHAAPPPPAVPPPHAVPPPPPPPPFAGADGAATVQAPPLVDAAATVQAPPLVDAAATVQAPPLVDAAATVQAPPLVDGAATVQAPPLVDGAATVQSPPPFAATVPRANPTGPSSALPPLPQAGPYVPPPSFQTGPAPAVPSARTGPSPVVPSTPTGPSPVVPSTPTGPSPVVPSTSTGPSPVVPSAQTGPAPVVGASTPSGPISTGAPNEAIAVPPTRPSTTAHPPRGDRPIPQLPLTKKQLMIGGGAVAGLAVVIAFAAGGDDKKPGKPPPIGSAAVAATTSDPNDEAVSAIIERANKLIAAESYEQAVATLRRARKAHPDNAELAFLSGKANFGRLWWTDGIADFRNAIELDGSYRENPELLKTVLRGFITTPDADERIVGFMREIGPPFRPYLEETAEKHPRKAIRARARAELNARP